MRLLALALAFFAAQAAHALPAVEQLQATTPQNIPLVSGAVSNIFISVSTVVTVTVPSSSGVYANTAIVGGDNAWVCFNPGVQCGPTFPTSTVSTTGWVFNPSGRQLKGNLISTTTAIYMYARPQDMVSGTATSQNIGAIEWFKQ